MPKGYVEEILRARVYDVAVESDLTPGAPQRTLEKQYSVQA